MLNSGAFAANLRKMRGSIARPATRGAHVDAGFRGRLSVPVPSQGLHLVAKFAHNDAAMR